MTVEHHFIEFNDSIKCRIKSLILVIKRIQYINMNVPIVSINSFCIYRSNNILIGWVN